MVDISLLGFTRDTVAVEWLIREVGVAGVPGSSFFREPENRFIRFHFAKKEETLHAAGERLLKLARSK
jgi:aminotransferase